MALIDFQYIKEIVQETIHFIQIPSVKDTPSAKAPFGKEIKRCLDYTLSLCQNLGMRIKIIQNTLGYAEYGEGEDEIGVLVHLDVVPADEEKWTYPPFQGVMEDNKIYGRGAIDDKGPTVAVIYAVKRLIDDVQNWNKRIRIIFCTDEETAWQDIPVYLKHEKESKFALTPDASFPLIYAEKGIIHLECKIDLKKDWLLDFTGGTRPNIVPDEAIIQLDAKVKPFLEKKEQGKLRFVFEGKAAHGSLPEKGKNAISKALGFLAELEEEMDEEKYFQEINKFFKESNGKGLGINLEDKKSGKLTMNVGKVEKKANQLIFTLDIRYPVSFEKELILDKIREKIPDTREIFSNPPLYKDLESPEIKILLEAYEEVMHKEEKPVAIGGGTLARAFKNAVAFGCLFPDDEETAHMSNEYITVEDLLKAHEIYYHALKKLLESNDW